MGMQTLCHKSGHGGRYPAQQGWQCYGTFLTSLTYHYIVFPLYNYDVYHMLTDKSFVI